MDALATVPNHIVPIHTRANRNPARIYLASLAPGSSRVTMQNALETIARLFGAHFELELTIDTMPWEKLRSEHVTIVIALLQETPTNVDDDEPKYRSARTINKMLSALRQVIHEAWRLGYMNAEERDRTLDFKAIKSGSLPPSAGRAIESGERRALIEAAMRIGIGPNTRARNTAIVALHYGAGLRRTEISKLKLDSYNQREGRITVIGKRNKTRRIPLPQGTRDAIDDWLLIRGCEPGPLFCKILKNDRMILRTPLGPKGIHDLYQRLAAAAGIAHMSTHDMRRTFASDLLDAGVDLPTVQQLMGHANVATTAGYDRRGEEVRTQAIQKLHVPYRKKGSQRT